MSHDITQLKHKLEEINNQIKDEKNLNEKLRSYAEQKIQTIKNLEKEISIKKNEFNREKEEILARRKYIMDDNKLKIDAMKRQQQDCIIELSRYDITQQEFDRLDAKLKEIAKEYYEEDHKLNEQIELRRRQAFDMKMAMDQVFRKTLTNIDTTYQERAVTLIEEEANKARDEVKYLKKTSDMREKQCIDIIRKQQSSYDKMVKEKVNLDVLKTTTLMQEQLSIKTFASAKETEE